MKNNKIIIGFVLAVIAISGMYVAMAATADYTLTVSSAQNTALTGADGAFGTVVAGATDTIVNTFTLTNTGNAIGNVSAKFTTQGTDGGAGTYGMFNASNVIPGTAFGLKKHDGTYTTLLAVLTDKLMTDQVSIGDADQWTIQVAVPSGQTAASYSGTIELTFSTAS